MFVAGINGLSALRLRLVEGPTGWRVAPGGVVSGRSVEASAAADRLLHNLRISQWLSRFGSDDQRCGARVHPTSWVCLRLGAHGLQTIFALLFRDE